MVTDVASALVLLFPNLRDLQIQESGYPETRTAYAKSWEMVTGDVQDALPGLDVAWV